MERVQASGRASRASRGPLGWFALAAIAAAVFTLDQVTKHLVAQNLGSMGRGYQLPVLGDWVRLTYTTNTGAAFGILPDQTVLLTIVALAAIPVLVYAQNHLPMGGWGAKVCVGLLLGGTLGNLTDRLRLGYVVDFVDVGFGNLRWWTFNLADSAFVIGVFLLMLYVFLGSEAGPKRDVS